MNLSVGIIGLPNVGKSTLFNALLKKQSSFAEASAGQAGSGGARVGNFPFTTIEPNIGIVPVPDDRLNKLAEIVANSAGPVRSLLPASAPSIFSGSPSAGSVRAVGSPSSSATRLPPIIPATVNFVDIAGLVKGASEGAGLGNKFLSHIREVSIIAHVVRVFDDPNVIRHQDSVGPRLQSPEATADGGQAKEDYGAIETELALADLQTIEQAQGKVKRFAKESEKLAIEKLFKGLNEGKPAREIILSGEEQDFAKTFFLLSAKPEIIVLNVAENDYGSENSEIIKKYSELLGVSSEKLVVISAKIESDLSELSEEEQKQYLSDLGVKESGLERLIKKAYETLGLISFLTAGEKEVRAWTLRAGLTALRASGEIHTDFMKKFIKAEVVSYDDFVSLNGWKKARENGKARIEGRDYIVNDGDVVEFKIGT